MKLYKCERNIRQIGYVYASTKKEAYEKLQDGRYDDSDMVEFGDWKKSTLSETDE